MLLTKNELKRKYRFQKKSVRSFIDAIIETAYAANVPDPDRQAQRKIVIFLAELKDKNSAWKIRRDGFGKVIKEDIYGRLKELIWWETDDDTNFDILKAFECCVKAAANRHALKRRYISTVEYNEANSVNMQAYEALPNNKQYDAVVNPTKATSAGWWA